MRTAVIIPCYKVRDRVIEVVSEILGRVDGVFVIDDKCPEGSGRLVEEVFEHDPSVHVIFHTENQGVGGTMATGYRAALEQSYDIFIKMDGDGQMDPGYIEVLIAPIRHHEADYTKANRFHAIEHLKSMPPMRIFGNSILSFVNKASSGYWNVMDPTNGYTAIHSTALRMIDLEKVSKRYFFESDMLFRLGLVRAVVRDIPMPSVYQGEKSNLKISKVALDFPGRYLVNFIKRLFYNYFLRDLNPASIETLLGTVLVAFSLVSGIYHWAHAGSTGDPTPTGTVVLVAMTAILGAQLLLAALAFDMTNIPKEPLQTMPGLQVRPEPLRVAEPHRTNKPVSSRVTLHRLRRRSHSEIR